jgi:hypothetical protein
MEALLMKTRLTYIAAAGIFLTATLTPAGAFAQANGGNNGGNGNSSGPNGAATSCTQATAVSNPAGGAQTSSPGRSNSADTLVAVVDAVIQDVHAADNVNLQNALASDNIQIVCLNDVLNQNDIRVLQDVLNGSPVASNDLNHSLNNPSILSGLSVANGAQIVAVDVAGTQGSNAPTAFLLRNVNGA